MLPSNTHRLSQGEVTAFDCYSKDVREPFRVMVTRLAEAIGTGEQRKMI